MIRATCLVIAAILILAVPADAQNNPPEFVDTLDYDTILEGQSINWFIMVTDLDVTDSFDMYLEPPDSELANIDFINFDDSTWNFTFGPFYDYIDVGDSTLSLVFYATDYTDTISMPVSITVEEYNPPPSLDPITNDSITEGYPYKILITATDPDGSIPRLELDTSSAPLITTATFVDNGDGTGLFSFTPDAVHYGDSVSYYDIFFWAFDAVIVDSSDVESFTLKVVGPNLKPSLGDHGPQTVDEGDSLVMTITVTDQNITSTPLEISIDTLLDSMYFIPSDADTAVFKFFPDYVMYSDSIVPVTFYADDGQLRDTLTFNITVEDAGNQQPVIDLPPPFVVAESIDDNCTDSSSVLITASDPEGGPVTFEWLWDDSLLGATFEVASFTRDTLRITICPKCYEGGTYEMPIIITDDTLVTDTFTVDTVTVIDTVVFPGRDSIGFSIAVAELNEPPDLNIYPPESESINEGEIVRIDWSVFDSIDLGLQVDIFPPADSSLFKGSMSSVNYGDSGFLEFTPDYNFVEDISSIVTLKFTTADACETVIKEKVITVYNVDGDPDDPGEPDTLTLVGAVWDESISGFKLTTRIWNDSAIAAALTGFRWYDPNLECDSVRLSSRLDSAQYTQTDNYIFNDSMMFLVSFIFFNSMYLSPGDGEYFTAYFTYYPDIENNDTIPYLAYDTAKVGSSGEFYFDKRIREGAYKDASADDLILSASGPFTYKPLINFGNVRTAYDSVSIRISDMAAGISLGRGDVIFPLDDEGQPKIYNLRLSIENKELLDSLSMGLKIYSDDEAVWDFQDPPTAVISTSRMYPDTDVWQGSAGLEVTVIDTGLSSDIVYLSGASGVVPDGGLSPGLMEYMISIPLTVGGVTGDEVKNICFDIVSNDTTIPWQFVTKSGIPVMPGFSGSVCFPVANNPIVAAGDEPPSLPGVYSLGQNYPNPFNPSTIIRFSTARRGEVKIVVYNILGQVVTNLADRTFEAGTHIVSWDGRDRQGRPAASGIYLYHMISEGLTETKKMVLLR
jgi:hypothetical protein